ncbi:phage virion morphogenesis protein [Halarcobacter anaerophilus]|jgi:phage virion morphogenesis protein|uniref:phage virion morphogenesis protein n=1 Tax=Halarcobacter anaerophilus TaxID=877500 RepID=UPI0005C958C9|nr:phage virion morphogenesis protein [Halarcobacter anaerophilus]
MLQIRVYGLEQIQDKLNDFKLLGEAPLQKALQNIGQVITSNTIERFEDEVDPQGTPWKRRKKETKKTKGKKILQVYGQLKKVTWEAGVGFVKIGPTVNYGKHIQFGTKHMDARPFLGINKNDKEDIIDVLESQLRKHYG